MLFFNRDMRGKIYYMMETKDEQETRDCGVKHI